MRVEERTVGAGVLVISGALFVVLAAVLVPWSVPGGAAEPVAPTEVFTAEQVARGEHFSRWARVWGWSSLAVQLLTVTLFLTRRARALLERLRGPRWLRVVLVVTTVTVVIRLVTLPMAVAAQAHRRDHGLSVQSWPGWVRDVGVSLALSTLVTALAVLVLLATIRRWERAWPVVAAALLGGAVVAGSWLYPVAVEPLFNSFTPMAEGSLRDSVLDLAEVEGVTVDDVLVADASRRTTSLNAYVSGLGGTRRVVVYDTLVEEVPEDQALSVVAHELAHAAHRDVLVGTALGALGAAAGVGALPFLLRRRNTVAIVTGVLAVVAWSSVVTAPVENGISRRIEVRADWEALKATGDPVAFVEVQKMLALRSLADPTPPTWSHWWWGSHPTVLERIAMARL